jgi:PIN domain nuclease of toxin-antitoxin system
MKRVLIDTHVLLWAWEDDPRLGRQGRKLLADPDQPVMVSIVSIWEIAIKKSVGKLGMDIELEALINSLDVLGFELLPLHPAHTLLLATLPLFHRDPFDRTLIAQAISGGLQLLTADPAFEAYKVQLIKI